MRNLKKLLAVVLAICVIATFTAPAFAADAAAAPADSKICSDLGVLQGDGNGVTAAYLAKGTTRLQAAILQLRLLGKEDEALAETSTENFADAKDLAWAEGRNVLAYLKKNPSLGWVGDGTNFKPNEITTTQMIYKVMLVSLGFEEGAGKDFQYADTITFAAGKGLTKIATKTTLTNDDTATALVEALKANIKDGTKTLAADLVAKNIITAAAADATGLVLLYKPVALDVSSAVALNSKTVELSLGTAAVAADVAAATITVKDAAGAAIAVTGAALAPWSTDGKSVLVTLEANTVAGTLYTMTVGAKTANFGGKAADTTAPTVTKVESTDYNQITVTFSEPILLGGAVTAALKYTPKTALATSAIAYASSSSITVATDPQAASLYGVTVNGFKDLAGTAMTEDTAKTFIGQTKSTTVPAIASITVVDSKSVKVVFNEKMDATTSIDLAKYSAALNYTPKTALTIASAVKDADDATGKTVILTFATDTVASLYQVTVAAGVTSKYGVASTAASTLTFVGVAADTTKLGTPTITNVSNTKITLDFGDPVADKVDPATTKDAFAIKLKYTPFTVLEISSISIDKEVVTITTAAQATSLYEVTIKSGIKDAKGNATTADIATTFVGQAVAAKITKVSTIVNGDSGTTLTLTFDQSVGTGAFDVANYFISGGIGYPTKAEAVTSAPASVKLTIPATTLGTNYTITVKNVSNADGIAMDAAGITKTFIGAGAAAGLAQMVAVQTLDEQTIKVYFDRDVTDAKIATIWDSTNKYIKATKLTIDAAADLALTTTNTYAYQDAVDKTALVIRVDSAAKFNAANKDTTVGAFKLIADASAGLNADNDELVFVPSETDMAAIGVVNVQAIDKDTLKVYFDQPAYINAPYTFATVTSNVISTGLAATPLTISSVVAVAGTNNMEYLVKLSGAMVKENKDYTLKVDASAAALKAIINDTSVAAPLDFVTLADEDGTTTANVVISRIFAPVFTAAADITDIAVQMADSKTIVVYYPTVMDETDVKTKANYSIMNGAATPVAVTMTDGTTDTAFNPATDIGNITWDAATNTAKIVLNKTIKTFVGGAFLYFDKTIANATGTAFVKNDTAQVTKQFAVSTAAAAEVGISSVTVSTTAGVTTVKIVLDQKSTVAGGVYADGAGFLANFSITKQVYGVDTAIASTDIVGAVAFATDDTFTVTLGTAIPANTGVIVKGILTDKTKIKGMYNLEGLNDASEVIVAAQ